MTALLLGHSNGGCVCNVTVPRIVTVEISTTCSPQLITHNATIRRSATCRIVLIIDMVVVRQSSEESARQTSTSTSLSLTRDIDDDVTLC